MKVFRMLLVMLPLMPLIGGGGTIAAQDPEEQPEPAFQLPAEWTYIEPITKKFFGALKTGSFSALNDSIKSDWAQIDTNIPMSSGLSNFLQVAGPMTSCRLMRIESVKDLGVSDLPPDIYRAKFLAFHEARPIVWQMEFLKWRDRWRLLKVDHETEYILEGLSKPLLEVRALKAQFGGTMRFRQ